VKLVDEPESAWHGAVVVPEVHPETLKIKHPLVTLARDDIEKLLVNESSRNRLGVVRHEVIDRPPHLLMDRRDVAPYVVYTRPRTAAAQCVTFLGNGDVETDNRLLQLIGLASHPPPAKPA
jgi:hypothetical protein